MHNPLELVKFELLSQTPRALLHLDLIASPVSFLPYSLDCSNTELLLHMHSVLALAVPFDWNLLPDFSLHFLLLT